MSAAPPHPRHWVPRQRGVRGRQASARGTVLGPGSRFERIFTATHVPVCWDGEERLLHREDAVFLCFAVKCPRKRGRVRTEAKAAQTSPRSFEDESGVMTVKLKEALYLPSTCARLTVVRFFALERAHREQTRVKRPDSVAAPARFHPRSPQRAPYTGREGPAPLPAAAWESLRRLRSRCDGDIARAEPEGPKPRGASQLPVAMSRREPAPALSPGRGGVDAQSDSGLPRRGHGRLAPAARGGACGLRVRCGKGRRARGGIASSCVACPSAGTMARPAVPGAGRAPCPWQAVPWLRLTASRSRFQHVA